MITRARTAAEQLLIEQAVLWTARLDTVRASMARRPHLIHEQSPAGHAARTAALGVTEGWTVLYLLTLIRQLDPGAADRAARYLTRHAAALTPDTCEVLVQHWRHAAETGAPTDVPLDH